jgi:phosphate transport system protein
VGKTRKQYVQELETLKRDVYDLGVAVVNTLESSVRVLSDKDAENANRIIAADDQIDARVLRITDRCAVMIATEQPVAGDLRTIMNLIHMCSDLERMGDHAVKLSRTTLDYKEEEFIAPVLDRIPAYAAMVVGMVRESLEAFVNLDSQRAVSASAMDTAVDKEYAKILSMLFSYIEENPTEIEKAIAMLFVARFLERSADHAKHICQGVIYINSGDHVEL